MTKRSQPLINEEVTFLETEELVSTTDLRGVITYVNEPFCRVAGYSREELHNKNHNVVRHPEMPKEAFKDLWAHLKKGQAWRGAVRNRCKDGKYYWVDAFVTPIYQNGKLTGYQSVRRKLADPLKKRAEELYASLLHKKSAKLSSLKALLNYPIRLSFAVLCSILIIACSYWVHPLLNLAIPLLIFLCMYRELVTNPQYEQRLKRSYDSVSRQIYCEDPDNIAEFHLAMNEGRIKTILGRAADSSVELSHKVKELENASHHSTHSIKSEAIELEKVSSAMEEMLATTKEIAQNSTQTSEQIHDANEQCAQATHRMTSTQTLMDKLVHDVDSSSKSTLHLSEQIDSIQELMTDITGIAGQTNLLALNAAIEAARAGEQGRGFAVVADEVRNLSQKSHKTAERIQESMSKVISAAQELEVTMRNGEAAAKETLDNMAETQLSITNLTSIMTDIEGVAYQISTATEQQIAVTNEINHNIAMIHDTSQSNLDDANQVNHLSQDIEKKSQQLRSLSQSFN